jgi:hypothetical protein
MARATREPQIDEAEDATITTSPLPYERAEDLLPDIAQLISSVIDRAGAAMMAEIGDEPNVNDAIMAMLPTFGALATQLGGGKLKALAPLLLASTSVVLRVEGVATKYDLVKKDERAACFDERPDLYFRILWHAGRTTFGRFFPVGSLLTRAIAAAKAKTAALKATAPASP